jgi:hypothetical protein
MQESELPEIASMLQNLQPENPVQVKKKAAEQLGELEESNREIVQALIAAKELDPSYQVRVQTAESLRQAVHQEILDQYPELMASAGGEPRPSLGHPLLEDERDVVSGGAEAEEKPAYHAYLGVVGRFLGLALLVGVGAAVLVAIVCWLIGWRSWAGYASGLRYGAVAVFVFGAAQVLASSGLVSREDQDPDRLRFLLKDPHKQLLRERDVNFDVFYVVFAVALALWGVAALIDRMAGS